jgi:integrase
MEAAAPLPPQWKQSSLPPRLGPEEIERVLAVYQEGTASALRDRAILFLLARLGLRAQDVALMGLDDGFRLSDIIHEILGVKELLLTTQPLVICLIKRSDTVGELQRAGNRSWHTASSTS